MTMTFTNSLWQWSSLFTIILMSTMIYIVVIMMMTVITLPHQWWSPASRQQSTGCKAVTAFGRQSIAIQQLNSEQGGIRKLHRHYHHHQTSENQTVNAKNDNNKKRFCSMGVNFTIQILTIFCKNSLQYQYFFLKNILFRDHKYRNMKRISFLGQLAAILCF